MSNLLALDQASKISGYAIFQDGKLIKSGKFELEYQDMGKRLHAFRNKIKELIIENKIDEVIYEDIQQQNNVANNVQTFKILAQVQGVLMELFAAMEIPSSSVLAVQWKSALGIKGRTRPEQKRNAQEYVTNTYGFKATQDESDAICIGAYKLKESINDWSF